jgi:hypothetical protein
MDWITLQGRLASDPDFPERTARLLALEAVLDGRQYDSLPFAFSSERSGGGEYVPLSERRPSVRTGLCRVVVEDAVSLLFSDGHFPMIQATDPRTVSALSALIKECRLNETMLEAATRGSVGSIAILFRTFEGRPFFDVLSSAYLTPEWSAEDSRRLVRVTELFKVRGVDLVAQGYAVDPKQRFWFRRVWDEGREVWFEPVPVGTAELPVKEDAVRSVEHRLGFVPIVWIKNLPGSSLSAPDGACTFAPAIDTVIETDYLLSQAGRGLKYGSDPTLVLKDGGELGSGGPQRVGGASTALVLPPEGDAKLLEINGNAAAAVLAHVRELRAIALEAMHGNRAHGDRVTAAQSGRALELLCQGLIWLADRLRISYGEGALLSLLRMVCLASSRSKPGVEIMGESYASLDPSGLGLRWPDWFAPSFSDRQAQANTLCMLVNAGILSRETALGSIASIYDVENLAEETDRVVVSRDAQTAGVDE